MSLPSKICRLCPGPCDPCLNPAFSERQENAFVHTGWPVVWDSYLRRIPNKNLLYSRILAWKPLIALNFGLGLILAYAQRAHTYLAVRILDLSRVQVQITLFGAEYTLCKAGPAAPVVLALQHPVTDRVHRNHTESLNHFKVGPADSGRKCVPRRRERLSNKYNPAKRPIRCRYDRK
ncbi:hypothetical protein J6590_082421 [Homalodisca vitripennis]|nr:hypothetical protein J6590_082421 [Homalodisca vitripennis]